MAHVVIPLPYRWIAVLYFKRIRTTIRPARAHSRFTLQAAVFFFSPPRFLAPGPTTFVSFTRIRVQCPKSVAPLPDFLLFRGITFVVLCISMKHYNFPWVCCLRCPNREPIPCSRLALPPNPALLPSLSLQSQVVSCSHISVPRFFPLRTVPDRS